MKQDIDELLERYYEGETTLAEERILRQFFQGDNIPPHLESHAAQFRLFADARKEHLSMVFNNQLAEKLNQSEVGKVRSLTTWSLRIAAGVALLMLGFAGGLFYDQWRTRETALSTVEATSALEMKKVLAFEQMPNTSASERIQAVNQSYDLTQADQDITQLLINTLNFDDNVNVRLAACQALLRFENEPGVREALIQSLSIQTDPNVQINLIESLVAIKEKRAVEQIQRLAKNQQVLDVVRVKAEEGINRLAGSNSPS
ncbi:hypothetical protein BN8_02183 [Fibrisoma limi BUZ 3]|uniref:HEAT repeat domain-containing protein n=1 Tax=Fibrisoma limi BUZ 3 TaxID=1185876 RepID=I2GGU1_9BACT|nr:HEAT repeat domain-containing protein [Fibrisoma limi]CCH53116.1 hypothetical protein BN8_02183 [Fibrisoma limi BUZ 3]